MLTCLVETAPEDVRPFQSAVSDAPPFRLGYRPALDGLRAVSVLAVMLHHSGLLGGGWLGVDVFFTLSGFLITSLLLDEHERTGAISLSRFYARRALRLLPALVALAIVWGTIIVALKPKILVAAVVRLTAVLFYAANWALMAGLGLYPLSHTWSLAIEEQFYALWPLALLFLLARVRSKPGMLAIVGGGAAASLAWRNVLVAERAPFAWVYMGLDTRADSILIGCALAMVVRWRLVPAWALTRAARWLFGAGAAVGLGALLAVARYPADLLDHSATTLTALCAALLISQLLLPGSRLARVLEWRPLVAVGRISYGLYLWHFPTFVLLSVLLTQTPSADPVRLAVAWLLTFAVCIVSYRFLETPALRLKARLGDGAAVPAGTLSRSDRRDRFATEERVAGIN